MEGFVPYFRENVKDGNNAEATAEGEVGDMIDQLNAMTRRKSAKAVAKPDDPAFGCYELVKQGHTVSEYQGQGRAIGV